MFLGLLAWAGCSGPAPGPGPAPEPLRLAAASDLQAVLPEVVQQFTADTGIAVAPITFGASGQLAEQVRQGAPFDVFLAADEDYVKNLARDGSIAADTVAVYAKGRLVLVAASGRENLVRSIDDLKGPEVRRVAIANPEFAPYGKAARRALEAAGLWDTLGPKLVRGESVRQALQFVQTGDADAGLVGHSIARDTGLATIALDPTTAPPIPQAMGVVASSKHPEQARVFARFVLDQGRAVLKDHGYDFP
jgi:molybdate transport system substrate-binding protein